MKYGSRSLDILAHLVNEWKHVSSQLKSLESPCGCIYGSVGVKDIPIDMRTMMVHEVFENWCRSVRSATSERVYAREAETSSKECEFTSVNVAVHIFETSFIFESLESHLVFS